jgi:phosphoglycerate dehydrogenase-like enzyme
VARIGSAFGMDVVAWSQHLSRERIDELGVTLAPSLVELLATSDVVSIHLTLGERTRGLLGRDELARMRPSAFLVNTSRSAIVDGPALVDALVQGRIAGAGLDVFDREPLPAGHPLRSAPRTVLSPHLGYVTDGTYRIFYGDAVEDIVAWQHGEPLRVVEP